VIRKPVSAAALSPAHHGREPSPSALYLSLCSGKLAEEQGSTARVWPRLRLARRVRHTTAAETYGHARGRICGESPCSPRAMSLST